jgi:hypothetical protein
MFERKCSMEGKKQELRERQREMTECGEEGRGRERERERAREREREREREIQHSSCPTLTLANTNELIAPLAWGRMTPPSPSNPSTATGFLPDHLWLESLLLPRDSWGVERGSGCFSLGNLCSEARPTLSRSIQWDLALPGL